MAWETSDAPKITEIANKVKSPAAEKPTEEEVAVVEKKQEKVTTEAKKDLAQLKQEFQAKQKSERINMKQHTEALKKTEYQKQVGYILGIESTDPVVLKQRIKDLQKALDFKDKAVDGALGPKTFDALKVQWEKRKPPDQDYKTFIDGLMSGKTETPTTPTNPVLLNNEPTIPGSVITETVTETDPTKDLKLNKDFNKVIFGNNSFDFELQWDWKTLGVDRDAYKIIDNQSSYDLNIRWKEDNVRIDKSGLKQAIEEGKQTVEGTTIPKKGWLSESVTIIINKTEGEKEPVKKEDKTTEGTPVNPTTNDTSPNNMNITVWNITLDTQNAMQLGVDTRSSLEQNLSNIPLHQDFQVNTSIGPALQAQIAIQPVQDAPQDTAT